MCHLKEKCLNKDIECHRCSFNIKVSNCYKPYEPTCPKGEIDCIYDPAYIKYHHPDWYKELYNDLSPQEAMEKHCIEEDYCYYDDEDK